MPRTADGYFSTGVKTIRADGAICRFAEIAKRLARTATALPRSPDDTLQNDDLFCELAVSPLACHLIPEIARTSRKQETLRVHPLFATSGTKMRQEASEQMRLL